MPKTLPSLVKLLHEYEDSSPESNSHYLFCDKRGVVHTHFNDICFARFKANKILKARLYINQHKRFEPAMQKKVLEYINWVVKKSPWRHAFKNTHSQKAYLRDGLCINTNVSSCYAVGAMTAVREAWEYADIHFKTLDKFMEMGLSREFSAILSNLISDDGSIYAIKSQHGTFYPDYTTLGTLLNFKGGRWNLGVPMRKRATIYQGIHQLFSGKGVNIANSLKNLFTKVENPGSWYEKAYLDFKDEKVIAQLKEWDNAKD